MLPRGCGSIFQAKYQEATLKHMKVTHFGTASSTTFDFTGLDKKCNLMEGKPTIRSLILGIKAKGTEDPLFLAVNSATKPHEKGGFVITYQKRYEQEAVEKINNLAAYFKHRFGSEALERFTQEAVDTAETTIWDTENDRPITAEEMFLEEIVEEEINWIANLDDVTFANTSEAEVILERPAKLSASHPRMPTSTDADTIVTFHPGQEVAATQDTDDITQVSDADDSVETGTTIGDPDANDGSRAARPHPEAHTAEVLEGTSASGA
jgi:hypothetical protein